MRLFYLTFILLLISACTQINDGNEVSGGIISTFKEDGISLEYYTEVKLNCSDYSPASIKPIYTETNSIVFYPHSEDTCFTSAEELIANYNLSNPYSSMFSITIDQIDEEKIMNFLKARHGSDCKFKKTILNPSLFEFEDIMSGPPDESLDCHVRFAYRYVYNVDTNKLYYLYFGHECIYYDSEYPERCNGILANTISFY
jgi:hypothetical protein